LSDKLNDRKGSEPSGNPAGRLLAQAVENWPAKALSLALALLLFVFHRINTLEDRYSAVPLNIENQTDMVPSSSLPRTIRISLRGDAEAINSILEDDIEAYIDLSIYGSPGSYLAPVHVRRKGGDLGFEGIEIGIDPPDIRISLDRKSSKFVPLNAVLRGQVEVGYVLRAYSLNPTQVVIEGPSEQVENIRELSTDFIDLDGRTGDFTVMVNIINRNPLVVVRGNGMTEFRGTVSRQSLSGE